VALLALTAVSLSCLVLGIAVIPRNPLGIGARILSLLGPAVIATGLLAVIAPDLASPVYCTMVVLGGTALIGVGAKQTGHPESRLTMTPASRV
jgi:hypothetical protein